MISFNQIRAYRKTMVSTAEPVELVRLLVDSALRYTTQAQDSLKTGRIRQKCEDLARAGQIVTELMNCLDFRRGGEIALTLESLYVFILQKITDANLTNDPGQLDGVIKVLADLSSAWSSISSDSYAGAC
ncbi:MAG: flagellar export chaperone FliS [Deltaproteobacteria bacterium]|nr:flagellar export chaperone FliS [Deltaproteobacteria bacterium]